MIHHRALHPEREAEFFAGLRAAGDFFMGKAAVQRALEKLTRLLDEEGIPYAIIGAMALNEYGFRCVTEVVGVLLTANGLALFKQRWLGKGYVEKFPGSKGLRDTQNDVPIDVVIAGEFPEDGQPKPVSFPDPDTTSLAGEKIRLLPLESLLELKLASGMSAPHRLRDLADVIELIGILRLPDDLGQSLDPSVRAKYHELWIVAQGAKDGERMPGC